MNKSTGSILLLIVGGLLLAYTAFRSVHILSQTLPPDAQVMAYIGLAGLDGGLIGWTIYKMKSARGNTQHAVSTLMIVVQLAGVALTSIGDSIMTANPEGAPEYIRVAVLWGVPAIIALNICAITVVHLSDPQRAIETASRSLEDEIQRQVNEHISTNLASIAARIAPAAAEQRASEVLAQYESQQIRGSVPVSKNGKAAPVALNADGVDADRGKAAGRR